MIVGNGDIAKVLKDRKDFIFFASGVSNSKEKRESEYKREINLLLSQDNKKHIVYFSSLCVFYNQNRYSAHKKHVEELIKKSFLHYTIIRMGNITWGDNPHTIINYFKNQLNNGNIIEIKDTFRYLITKSEFLHWIEMIPEWNCEMNLPGTRLKVKQIVARIKSNKL